MSQRRRPRRPSNRQLDNQDQEFQHFFDPLSENNRSQEVRVRPTRTCKVNYAHQQDQKQTQQFDEEEPMIAEMEIFDFLAPKVEFLLWRDDNQVIEDQLFLAKFLNRSYMQTKWMNRSQLSSLGFQVTSSVLKSVRTKMRKTIELKLKPNTFFNPNFLLPDRILTSTEIFTAIHHKRANDIKGKWDESIMLVCQKLLNFVKDGYPFGVVLHEPYNEDLEKAQGITVRVNIGQVLNKIYLGYYKNQWEFWMELGVALKNFLKIYKQEKGDYHRVGLTIRQCSIFLYEQWHILSKERYLSVRKSLLEGGMKLEKAMLEEDFTSVRKFTDSNIKQEEDIKQDGCLKVQQGSTQKMENQRVNIHEEFCKCNIFLTQKIVQNPRSQLELQFLNPGNFSFAWLEDSQKSIPYQNYTFLNINSQDMKSLDLNSEIDKLYYVKWKDLSYADATWQSEKNINSPEKIEEFKLWNKIPVREIRQKIEIHNKIHKFLMDYYEVMGDKKGLQPTDNITKMQAKLYLLDAAMKGKPKQYGGVDVPIYKNRRQLKDFQLQSLNWLVKSWYEGRNTILADEMGLGKTIQTIAFLYHLYTFEGVIGPFLVLAPLTTLQQWRRQIEEWTSFNCLLYYDQGASHIREILQEYQFFHMHTTKSGDIIPSKIPKFQVLLTNYQLFINDFQILKKIPYQHIVLDEAHRLKNKQTKTTTTLNKLPCCRKTLLTGTPIQNNTKQLWTLLNFIMPKEFASEEVFMKQYGSLSTQEQVKNFKKMLKPYLLRRVKQDVQSTIPRLSETIIDVEMTAKQKAYYRGILQKNKTAMLKSLSAANFNSISTQLRKCCNHPYLISIQTQNEIKQGSYEHQQVNTFIHSSGKVVLLMKLLDKFKKQSKKVLVFSQFVVMLDLLKPYLELSGYNCQILKGSQSSTSRHQAITRFNLDPIDVFLISTKAGGVGINLVAATEIIIFDSDWNPQNDIQATARAHRIGQKKQVTVYRLITANSYESEMFAMSSKKLGLDKAVFSGDTFKSMGQFDDSEKQLTKIEIQTLLKKGIMGFLGGEGKEQDFFDQTIQQILQKNGRKIQYTINAGSCTFSKTKFKSEETSDIKIDAPDFWEKALKDIQTQVDKLVKKRKQLKQYATLQSQQALMLETYRIVFEFVKQKTTGTGFNAQDQRNLLRFLEAINSERYFNRHYRDIADLLSTEILKPSRRFKVKEEDLFLVSTQNVAQPQIKKEISSASKRQSTRIRQRKTKQQNFGIDDVIDKQIQDEISDVQEEKQQEQSPQIQQEKNQQEKVNQDYQKLCYFCQRPKCTVFCKGICGRPFHKKCFQLCFKDNAQKPQINELQELTMNFEKWKQNKIVDKKCESCQDKNFIFKCSICLKNGIYFQQEAISKRKKSSRNKKQERQGDENTLYRCSASGKCNKFYHLACLFAPQFTGKFSDQTGRTIKDISTPSKYFRCPSHYCFACYAIDPKSTKLKSYTCVRCCKSFHDKCHDNQKFTRIGTEHYYMCVEHLQPGQTIQKMTEEVKLFKPNKKDKVIQKKAVKDSKKNRQKGSQSFKIEENKQITNQLEHSQPQKKKKKEKQKNKQKGKGKDQSRQKQDKSIDKTGDDSLRRSRRNKKDQNQSSQIPIQKPNQQINQQKYQTILKEQMKMEEQSESLKEKSKSKSKDKKINKNKKQTDVNGSQKQKSAQTKAQKMVDKQIQNQKEEQKMKPLPQTIFASFKLQYQDFKLTPIYNFSFSDYNGCWCRYCGTRFAKKFDESPWGDNKLCSHHSQQYKKGKLKLQKYKNQPKSPINKMKENQLRYLNQSAKKNRWTGEETVSKLNEANEQIVKKE